MALLACIRQDKADVLEALLPKVQHFDNTNSLIVTFGTMSIMPALISTSTSITTSIIIIYTKHWTLENEPPTQVEDVNSILKPEIEETLLHAAASVGSILCAKLLLEVILKDSCPWKRF